MSDEAVVKVGSSVWVVNEGNRTPPQRATITSESRTHWAFAAGRETIKVPKTPRENDAPNTRWVSRPIGSGLDIYFTDKALADAQWIEFHQHRIAERMRDSKDADLLRQIAALLGYDDTARP